MISGDEKFEAGDINGALSEYQQAYALVAVPSTGMAVARTLQKLGKWRGARDMAKTVIAMEVRPDEPPPLVTARKEAATLKATLDTTIPTLRLQLRIDNPSKLRVVVDGEPRTPASYSDGLPLDPGSHSVTVTGTGYAPYDANVALKPSERHVLTVTPTLVGAAALVPESSPNNVVPTPVTVEPGTGGDDDDGGLSPLVWVGFGVAGAGVITGAVAGGLAASMQSDVLSQCTDKPDGGQLCPSTTQDDVDSTFLAAHVSTAGFALAGAGAVMAIVGLVTSGSDSPGEEEASVAITPIVGPRYFGVQGYF